MNQRMLSILVNNHFGVLTKVTGLFGRRGYNITALSVGETEDPSVSRITVLIEDDDQKLMQICSQVSKLEEVRVAAILPCDTLMERELVLIKIRPQSGHINAVLQLVSDFSAKATAAGECTIIEASGPTEQVNRLIARAMEFNLVELSRTGATALERNENALASMKN